jgi:predicted O-methyltransferase YrrM
MIENYLKELESSRGEVLPEMEALAKEKDFPIIGAQCGRRLMILAAAIGAKKVFEMGSGYGYSTIWFCNAVGPDGSVVHTDGDADNTAQAKQFVERAGFSDRVTFLTGDANELLQQSDDLYDVILIDIDKQDYPKALEIAVAKLRIGGLILTHNTKWFSKIVDPENKEATTEGIREYNRRAFSHPQLATYIDPVDDGVGVSLKVDEGLRKSMPV